jgi:hypothetical protein
MSSALATYDGDIVVWLQEQARLLRSGNFSALDIEHIADEVEDVGKSEARELEKRMAILLAHLLKWHVQPERRGSSWEVTIASQREAVARRLGKTPSLKPELADPQWQRIVWGDAVTQAEKETGISDLPAACPWPLGDVLTEGWMPPA